MQEHNCGAYIFAFAHNFSKSLKVLIGGGIILLDFWQAGAKRIYNHESGLHFADHLPNVAAIFSPIAWRIIHAPNYQIFWNAGKPEIEDHPLHHGFELSHPVLEVEVHNQSLLSRVS